MLRELDGVRLPPKRHRTVRPPPPLPASSSDDGCASEHSSSDTVREPSPLPEAKRITTIFYWRRKVQSDDTVVINDVSKVSYILRSWRRDWESSELTPEQKPKRSAKKACIWRAFLRKHYGGLYFVCRILQTGMRHAPSTSSSNISNVAAEHVIDAWTGWLVDLSRCIKEHKDDPGPIVRAIFFVTQWRPHWPMILGMPC